MNKDELLDLIINTKEIDSNIIKKSKQISDFPLAYKILLKVEGSDFIRTILKPSKYGEIDIAKGDLKKFCIEDDPSIKQEGIKFIDELAEKSKMNFKYQEYIDLENNQDSEYFLGIDLGTTNTVAAVIENDKCVTIPFKNGGRLMPSIVSVNKSNKFDVGDSAKRQLIANPEETFYSVKRFIGRRSSDFEKTFFKKYPFKISTLDEKLKLISKSLNKELECEEISAQILLKVKIEAEEYLNTKINKCVITVPAYFDGNQRKATRNAATIAGLEVVRLINEPTAAAFAYELQKKGEESNTLVLDLGGGTFDISLVRSIGGDLDSFSVIASLGDRDLGGDDFTNNLNDHIKDLIKKDNSNVEFTSQLNALIKDEANKAKHFLSELETCDIHFPFLITKQKQTHSFSTTITRKDFDAISKPILKKIELVIEKFLKLDKLKNQKISKVVLVGGSSRIPIFKELVEKITNIKPKIDINPDEVVAQGAAFCAEFAASPNAEKIIIDVNPLSLGTNVDYEGLYAEIIPANTPLPTRKKEMFTTLEDNQTAISMDVLQGGRKFAADNIKLGNFCLENIEIAPKGLPQIETTFELDEDGILKVSALDLKTGSKTSIVIKNTLDISDNDIERLQNLAREMSDIDQSRINYYEDLTILRNWKKVFDQITNKNLNENDKIFIKEVEDFINNQKAEKKYFDEIKRIITGLRIIIQEKQLEEESKFLDEEEIDNNKLDDEKVDNFD